MSEVDNGEMVVVRHEYEEEWTDGKGETHRDRQFDAFFAVRDPETWEVSEAGDRHSYSSRAYRIPGDVYIYGLNDVAGYRKLLDAIEARIIAREAQK